jgi:hypothetical protein
MAYEMKTVFFVIARSPPWADDEAISTTTNEIATLGFASLAMTMY